MRFCRTMPNYAQRLNRIASDIQEIRKSAASYNPSQSYENILDNAFKYYVNTILNSLKKIKIVSGDTRMTKVNSNSYKVKTANSWGTASFDFHISASHQVIAVNFEQDAIDNYGKTTHKFTGHVVAKAKDPVSKVVSEINKKYTSEGLR